MTKWREKRILVLKFVPDNYRPLSILLTLVLSCHLAQAREIRFAPLPIEESRIIHEAFHGLVDYLSEEIRQSIKLVYYPDYQEILSRFQNSEIDLAYLGPLPLAILSKTFDGARPIGCFRESETEHGYRCALIAYGETDITLSTKPLRIGLTQPYSTCGYLGVNQILEKHSRQLEEQDIRYAYAGNHTKATLGVVRGEYDLAGVKSSIARRYRHLNVKILSTGMTYPGHLLVANTHPLTPQVITKLQQAMLKLDPQNNPRQRQMMQDWGVTLRHGLLPPEQCHWQDVVDALQRLPDPIPGATP